MSAPHLQFFLMASLNSQNKFPSYPRSSFLDECWAVACDSVVNKYITGFWKMIINNYACSLHSTCSENKLRSLVSKAANSFPVILWLQFQNHATLSQMLKKATSQNIFVCLRCICFYQTSLEAMFCQTQIIRAPST